MKTTSLRRSTTHASLALALAVVGCSNASPDDASATTCGSSCADAATVDAADDVIGQTTSDAGSAMDSGSTIDGGAGDATRGDTASADDGTATTCGSSCADAVALDAADAVAAETTSDAGSAMDAGSTIDGGAGDATRTDTASADVTETGSDAGGSTSPYGTWRSIATPPARFVHPLQVWTGTEALFYDGDSGAAYDPAADRWRTLPIPTMSGVGAAWTGSKVFVYAKRLDATGVARGTYAFFVDPVTGVTTETSLTGRPGVRSNPIVAWTGERILVMGGSGSGPITDVGQYDPKTDVWTTLPTSDAPGGNSNAVGIWTGGELLVWGGCSALAGSCLAGALYNPTSGTWRPMSTAAAPAPRGGFAHAWTGTTLFVWGGAVATLSGLQDAFDGAAYTLATNTWKPLPRAGLDARDEALGAWTGSELLVWSGESLTLGADWNDGARFSPSLGVWKTMSIDRSPGGCHSGGAVWTGDELVVVGGVSEVSWTAPCGHAAWRP